MNITTHSNNPSQTAASAAHTSPEKKSVLITGCSSGIGYCVAKGLHQRGYRVFATARSLESVERLQAEGLESCVLDLADTSSIHKAMEFVLEKTGGKLYALVNNGAYAQFGALEDVSSAALREQFETNVCGLFELTKLAIPIMRRQREGRIIQHSSILGYISVPYLGVYSASKHAIESLSDTFRMELYDSGVHVSVVEIGPIRTKCLDNSLGHFKRHVQTEQSVHDYQLLEAVLQGTVPEEPFTLGPEAVLDAVIHALEAERPKIRYYVTVLAHYYAFLRRILPFRCLDWVIRKMRGKPSYRKAPL